MCGIVGLVGGGVGEADVAALLPLIRHRGPDAEGILVEPGLALGMRRLAILDLAHGNQPFHAAGGRVSAFQNGEIYNHGELRNLLDVDGRVFRSRCDTEVVAHGYAAWGIEGLLERVDGMFAMAILDRAQGRLHLARDAFGEKPLFIASAPGRFAYSSSMVPLARLGWVDRTVDPLALDRYLALHFVPGEATIFAGIRRVLPGERLEIDIESARIVHRARWYRAPLGRKHECGVEQMEAALEHSVRSRLEADVPVGVFLSGGVDSSLVTAMAARHVPEIQTFSMGFGDASHDESAYAEIVARHVGARHTKLNFNLASFAELMPAAARALDEPLGDQALLPLYWLCREAGREVKVVLSGEGADEVFGGYFYYRGFADGSLAPQSNLYDAGRNAMASGYPLVAEAHARMRMTGRNALGPTPFEESYMGWLDQAASPLQRARAADLGLWLPDDLLVKLDRMTMAHSIEGRAPFLSRSVVELGLGLADRQVWVGDENKSLLRQVAHRWLPPDIVGRPKQGFCLPMRRWLREWFDANGGPRECFHDIGRLGLDPIGVAGLVEEDLAAGVIRDRLLLSLLMLVEWRRGMDDVVGN